MHYLYTTEEAEQLHQRMRRSKMCMTIIAVAALIACVMICFHVHTGNASHLLGWVIGLSTLAGWTCILTAAFSYYPAKAEWKHIHASLNSPVETLCGVLSVNSEAYHIPQSVTVCKAALTDGEETHTLHVLAEKVCELPSVPTRVRVDTVRRFIIAFEVCDEKG